MIFGTRVARPSLKKSKADCQKKPNKLDENFFLLYLRPKLKVKTIEDLVNNKNSNTFAYKFQIFKKF